MAKRKTGGGREAAMRPLVEEWRRGEASQAEVARRHGLNAGTFSWWCARLGGRKGRRRVAARSQPGLVAVRVVDVPEPIGPSPGRGRFELVLAEDLRVRVPAGFDAADLKRLLEVVRPC